MSTVGNALGNAGYLAAGVCFAALTVQLGIGWRREGWIGGRFIFAAAITAVWAFVLAAQSASPLVPSPLVFYSELGRGAAWILVLAAIAPMSVPRPLVVSAKVVCLALLGLAILIHLYPPATGGFAPWRLLAWVGVCVALFAAVFALLSYRSGDEAARHAQRHALLGIALLLGYDLLLYAHALLTGGLSVDEWSARGFVAILCIPMLAVGIRRNVHWALDIFVSRQVVLRAATLFAAAAYIAMVLLGVAVVHDYGGSWGGDLAFFGIAVLVLAWMLASPSFKRHASVWVSKHFYRNKYDYRIEWLRFIDTLSSRRHEDIRRTSIQAVAQILESPAGLLFVRDESGRSFSPVAAWPSTLESIPDLAPLDLDSELVRFMASRQWIVDLQEHRGARAAAQSCAVPTWMVDNTQLRIVSPILELDRLVGCFVLYQPPAPFELTYEDRDLLKTVGRHVATHLAQHEADRRLAESRQFDAYNRLTTFMMHDLKNAVAQLKLVVANAQRHRDNPSFIEDAMFTITNATGRISRLMEDLSAHRGEVGLQLTAPEEIVRRAIDHCRGRPPVPTFSAQGPQVLVRAHPDRLAGVIEHLIRNAQEASATGSSVSVVQRSSDTELRLTVIDQGCGMAPDFVRERLFRPFDTTKGSMGIGAYQVRDYVQTLGGRVEVDTAPGRGTSFSIILPVATTGAESHRAALTMP